MESHAIVHHRLDLILRLIDSTTGREISDKRCEIFMIPDKKVKPVARGDGIYLFLGIGREDFANTVWSCLNPPTDLLKK